MKEPEVHWFARGGGIKRMGPFPSQLQAWEALRKVDGEPVEDAQVWPERKVRK